MSDDAPKPGQLKQNATMEQVLQAQQRRIDEVAKNTVDRIKRLIEEREHLVSGANPTYEQLHGEWYRAIERDLSALGFGQFGQYRNANKRADTPPDNDVYYHLALSADRTITAAWFVVAAKEPRRCVVLESVAVDGTVIVTASGVAETGIPVPPSRDVEHFAADMPVAQLVAGHRAHMLKTDAALHEFADIQDILDHRLRQANETAEFRRRLGPALFERILRVQSRGQFESKGKPVLESILAHPEWWTDDVSPGRR